MINIILFGITGFGNAVLEELLDHKLKPKKIITRKEIGPDPHLKMMQISDLAKKHNIPVQYNKDYVSGRFDLCIVATYHLLINLKKLTSNTHTIYIPLYCQNIKAKIQFLKLLEKKLPTLVLLYMN